MKRVIASVLHRIRSGTPKDEPTNLRQRVTELERELAQLKQMIARRGTPTFSPFYSEEAFASRFRGSADNVRAALAPTAEWLSTQSLPGPVADLGCGAGELIGLLRETGIESFGVEPNRERVTATRALGFVVHEQDALEFLSDCAPASLGAVTAIQMIEHLDAQGRVDLIRLAHRALAPGGLLLVETVNPLTFATYANALYLDPTHTQPIHPLYLRFVFEQAGFTEVTHELRSPSPEQFPLDAFGPEANPAAIQRLNNTLFGWQDYVVIGKKHTS